MEYPCWRTDVLEGSAQAGPRRWATASVMSPSTATVPPASTTPRSQSPSTMSRSWLTMTSVRPSARSCRDPVQALALEGLVADGEDLVDEEDLGVGVHGHGEASRRNMPEE